ncbi:MAG: protoporphyrinogen oxidase [Acidobacteriota bacterium]
MKVAVIGTGISGLATAFHLQEQGHEVVVYEARGRPGGNIFTEEVEGCRVEWATNGFLDNEPATLDLVRALGIEDRLVRANTDAAVRLIWRSGKLRRLPTKPPQFLTSDVLPQRGKLRALREPFIPPRVGDRDESIWQFAARRLGKQAADVLVDAFVTGVWAGDPKRLSLQSTFPKLLELETEHGSLIKGMKATKRDAAPRGVLTSFDHGMQVLIDALASRLDLRLATPLTTLPSGYDHFVLTLPAPKAAELVEEPLAGALRRVPTAPVAVVALSLHASALDGVLPAFGFLVPRGQKLRMLGTLYSSHIFPNRAPEGYYLFRVLIGGRRDPDAVMLDDDALLSIAVSELEKVWKRKLTPRTTHVMRHTLGIAQYEIGHAALLDTIAKSKPPELHLLGTSYRGVSLNAAIAEAAALRID